MAEVDVFLMFYGAFLSCHYLLLPSSLHSARPGNVPPSTEHKSLFWPLPLKADSSGVTLETGSFRPKPSPPLGILAPNSP